MNYKDAGSWETKKLDDDKVMVQVREFYNTHFKNTMKWDVYIAQVYEKIKIYESLPAEDKQKFIQSQQILLSKAYREIQKVKARRENEK